MDFERTELRISTFKAPLDMRDEELQINKIIANIRLCLCLPEFIKLLPADVSEDNTQFPALYRLIEEYGLIVYDKVLDGRIVSSIELLGALRERQQQNRDSSGDNGFDFWRTLSKERKYIVERDDVATAYKRAGKSEFPWLSIETVNGSDTEYVHVALNVEEHAKTEKNVVTDDGKGKPSKKIFDKRLDALTDWLNILNLDPPLRKGQVVILPKNYTLIIVYTELGKYTEQSEKHKGLFTTIELNTFDSHFWGKQKIVELMRRNKSAIL